MGGIVLEKDMKNVIFNLLFFDLIIVVLCFGNRLIGHDDMIIVIRWYIMLVLSTFIGYPITSKIFKRFNDKGYVFAKILGFLIPGIIVYFLSNLHILKFSILNCVLIFLLCLIVSFIYLGYNYFKTVKEDRKIIHEDISKLFRIEVIFLIFMMAFTYVKAFNPAAADVEKFMDYGFMKSLSITDYLPAGDMWLSGYTINYYYFGHYIATFMSNAAMVSVDYGYNLMLVTLFVITLFSCYSIGNNLLHVYFLNVKEKKKGWRVIPVLGGIIAALSNTFAGNGHFLLYRYIMPFINRTFNLKSNYIYYYPDSTRYIGENPPTPDKTIHEFPSYSFFVGDLHAHLSDLIYVVFAIGLLLAYILKYTKDKVRKNFEISDAFNIYTIVLGFLIGIMKMTNYWDFPIYLVVALITFILVGMRRYKKASDVVLSVVMQMLIIMTISIFISLPSTLSFKMISTKIKFVTTRTVFYQFMVLWGIPLVMVITYFVNNIILHVKESRKNNNKRNEKDRWYKRAWMAIYNYFNKLSITDLFIIMLVISAIGLLIAPEIIYVVDIYDQAPRANTMFKFTYNSYIMFGFCFGYMLFLLIMNRKKIYKILGSILLVIFLATCLYLVDPTSDVFGNIFDKADYQAVDATAFLNDYFIGNYIDYEIYGDKINYDINMQDDLAMINYLKENANPGDVILEYPGDDFSFDNRISTFTGLPTVLGWVAHEWLWRSENSSIDFPPMLQERSDDVNYLYTSGDIDYNKYLIQKYNIKYIIVGYMERFHVAGDDMKIPYEDELKKLGDVVFETNMNDLPYPSYIIQVGN